MELLSTIKSRGTVFFIGAGASLGTGLPLGDEAAQAIIESAFDILGLRSLWHQMNLQTEYSWPRFEVVVGNISVFSDSAIRTLLNSFELLPVNPIQVALVKYSSASTLWLTTNFDDQLERSIKSTRSTPIVARDLGSMIQSTSKTTEKDTVIKLHGDSHSVNAKRDIRVTMDGILRILPSQLVNNIETLVKGKHLIFIGYAGRDPDLHNLIIRCVSVASSVHWIGKGKIPENIPHLRSSCKRFRYYDSGLGAVIPSKSPKSIPTERSEKWRKKLSKWTADQSPNMLAHVIAEISIHRDGPDVLGAVKKIHKRIDGSKALDRFHVLDRLSKLETIFGRKAVTGRGSVINDLYKLAYDVRLPLQIRIDSLHTVAKQKIHEEDFIKAKNTVEYAFNIADKMLSPRRILELRITLGTAEVYMGSTHLQVGLIKLENAIQQAKEIDEPILESDAEQRLAIGLMRSNESDGSVRAEKILKEAEKLEEQIGSPRRRHRLMMNLAETQRIQGRFHDAVATNNKLVCLSKQDGDRLLQIDVSINLALSCLDLGRIKEADDLFYKNSLEATGEAQANAVYNRGWTRFVLQLWDDSLDYFSDAERLFRTAGNADRRAGSVSCAIFACIRGGRINLAKSAFKRLCKMPPPTGSFVSEYSLAHIGLCLNAAPVEQWCSKIETIFGGPSEYTFYLALWGILEKNPKGKSIQKLVDLAIRSYKTVRTPLYAALLEQVTSYEPAMDIKKESLRELQEQIKVGSNVKTRTRRV